MSRQPRRAPRAARAALGAVTVVALATTAACGGDDPEAVGPSDDASTSSSPTGSASASASPTEDPSPTATASESGGAQAGDTFAGAEPATGPAFSNDGMTINPPADWTRPADGETLIGPTSDDVMQLVGSSTPTGDSTDDQAKSALEFYGFTPDSERLPDVVVLGQPAYHISGTDEVFGNLVDQFGFSVPSGDYLVRIATAQDVPQAQREQLIASSMVTLQVDGLP